ncbi:C4-dicarboxylate transporter [Natribaculum luteum]|uniref:C4-dicarboxylate transporter n=1 Tax=Natribaculum luteum TaxID=1586232 RepID=A0ABD5P0N0_9EURY|nr:C4-dicarboxylate transporter [Natribaculum luteum]
MADVERTTAETRSRISSTIEFFGPQWFGSTMGTGVLGVALALVAARVHLESVATLATAFVGLTLVATVAYAIPWFLRIVYYPGRVWADLTHPVRSQFFPTMPITLLVLGVGIAQTTGDVLPDATLRPLLTALFVAGSVGIFGFGLLLVTLMFTNDRIGPDDGVFAWYIPPVSHLVIPLLGFLLVSEYYAGTLAGQAIFTASVVALGVGTFMFLFFGSIVLYRYAYESLPHEKLAPTFAIGLAPTAVLAIDVARLSHALQAGVGMDVAAAPLEPLLKLLGLLLWGFSAWWFLLTGALVAYYATRRTHPFFFTWWAYTFPVGAFAVSTDVLAGLLEVDVFGYVLVGVTALLLVVWTVTAGRTVRLVARGRAFTAD